MAVQLTHVYNQILSVLTLRQLERIMNQRGNYDLRRLLGGNTLKDISLIQTFLIQTSFSNTDISLIQTSL